MSGWIDGPLSTDVGFFIYLGLNKEMIYQSPPLLRINQLSDTWAEADREADRGEWEDDGGGEETQRIRVARVKLETCPFNMS